MLYVDTGNCCRLFYSISLLAQEVKSSPPQTRMSFPAKSFIAGFLFIRTKARGMHAVNKIDLCPEQPDQRKAPTTAYGIFSHGPIKFRPVPPCALYRRDRRSLLQAGEPFIPVRPCRQPNTRSSRLMRTASFRDIEPVFKHFQRQASPCIRILTPSNGHKTVRGVSCWGGYKGPCRHVLKIDLKPFVPTQTARQEETILSQPKLPI